MQLYGFPQLVSGYGPTCRSTWSRKEAGEGEGLGVFLGACLGRSLGTLWLAGVVAILPIAL